MYLCEDGGNPDETGEDAEEEKLPEMAVLLELCGSRVTMISKKMVYRYVHWVKHHFLFSCNIALAVCSVAS